MKLLRRSSKAYTDLLLAISDWAAGSNALSYIIGIILTLGCCFLAFMLISRINAYNADPFEENFTEAKNMKKFTQWANSFMGLWIFLNFLNVICTYRFGSTRTVFLIIGIAGYVFSWYSLKKFSDANRNHNIELAKANKGDPSIIMAESFGLTQAQREAVSSIVGNAGASRALRNPKSDEELFGTIDDPVYDDPRTPRIVCRSCGKVNNPQHNICVYCGMTLDKTKTVMPSGQQSEIDKILNGVKKDEDPVQKILRSAGVIQTDNGKYISAKKAAEAGNEAGIEEKTEAGIKTEIEKIKVMPTTDKKPDKDISVTALPENGIFSPSSIDGSVSVTELKGTDFYKNSNDGQTFTEGFSDKSSFTADNSVKGNSAESVFFGGTEGQIRCRYCGEMNEKNSGRCIFCGTPLQ